MVLAKLFCPCGTEASKTLDSVRDARGQVVGLLPQQARQMRTAVVSLSSAPVGKNFIDTHFHFSHS